MGYVYYHDPKNTSEGVVKVNPASDLTTFTLFQTSFNKMTFATQRGFSKVCGIGDFQGKSPFAKRIGEDCLTVAKKDLVDFLNSLQLNTNVKQEENIFPVVLEYQAGRKDRVLMRMYED